MSIRDRFIDGLLSLWISDGPKYPEECLYISTNQEVSKLTKQNLPEKEPSVTRMVIVSDTHNRHKRLQLPAGDIFIHCGDIAMLGKNFSSEHEMRLLSDFNSWMGTIKCDKKIVVGGNHDRMIENLGKFQTSALLSNAIYLENSVIHIGGLSFWGTPYSTGESQNKAFQSLKFKEEAMAALPARTNILITHGQCSDLERNVKHDIHIWGHHHRAYGVRKAGEELRGEKVTSLSICAPIMDGHFKMTHLPIVIDVPVPFNANSTSSSSVPPGSIYAQLLDRDRDRDRDRGGDGGGSERGRITSPALTPGAYNGAPNASPALTPGAYNGAPNAVDTTPVAAVQHMSTPPFVVSWNDQFWRRKKVAPEQISTTSS